MGNALLNTSAGLLDSHIGAQQPLFQELRSRDTSFFDEGPNQITNKSLSSNSLSGSLSNLSSSWPYLQGVEITRQRQYDAGLAKIWSGEPGHQMAPLWYGEARTTITEPFSDDVLFTDPVGIIEKSPSLPLLLFPIRNAKVKSTVMPFDVLNNAGLRLVNGLNEIIILGNGTVLVLGLAYESKPSRTPISSSTSSRTQYRVDHDLQSTMLDGIIEPLSIRTTPSAFNFDVPQNVNLVGGEFSDGNADGTGASDRVLTVDSFYALKKPSPFIDEAPSRLTVSSDGSSPRSAHRSLLAPFSDVRYVRNVPSPPSEPNVVVAALSLMTGSTDGYVRYDQISATSGWYYDSIAGVGTDSIAFGGVTH